MKRKLLFLIFILSIFMQLSIVNSEVFAQDDNLQNFEYQYYNVEKQEQNSELDRIISKNTLKYFSLVDLKRVSLSKEIKSCSRVNFLYLIFSIHYKIILV